MEVSIKELESMMTRVLAEARKPAEPTEDEKEEIEARRRQKEQDKEMRRQQAELELQRQETRRIEQENCLHIRPRDNSTTMVHVANGNFMICQQCQKVLRAEENVQLWNRHFQLAQATASIS